MFEVLERLLARAQDAGAVRADIGAMDLMMMFKGACMAAAAFAHVDPAIIDRHLDLIRASVTAGARRVRRCAVAPPRSRTWGSARARAARGSKLAGVHPAAANTVGVVTTPARTPDRSRA